jgi:hypothetical protein
VLLFRYIFLTGFPVLSGWGRLLKFVIKSKIRYSFNTPNLKTISSSPGLPLSLSPLLHASFPLRFF